MLLIFENCLISNHKKQMIINQTSHNTPIFLLTSTPYLSTYAKTRELGGLQYHLTITES